MPNCSDCRPPPTWTPRLADRTEAPPPAGSHLQRPYPHATDDPGAVRHDHHIVAEPVHYLRGEASGIATADVQAVPQVHRPQLIHHPADPTGPHRIPEPQPLVLTDVFVIGQSPPHRAPGELLMRS